MPKNKVKNEVFVISVMIAAAVILYGYFFNDSLVYASGVIMAWVSTNFGWLYIAFVFFLCIFLTWLAFSRYGKIKLGKDYEKPQYSNFHWYAMLFCGGTGIGLVFWSIAEPLSHYAEPPEGVVSGTVEAANFSIRTCFLHWGITQWMCFAFVALGIAYFMYRKGKNAQISNLLSPLVGENLTKGWFGKAIDIFSVVVSFVGVATSLGLGVSQICGGLNYLLDVPDNASTWLMVIVVITCIFLASAVSGVDKGIKILSSVNTYLAFALLILAFVVGPKISIFNTMVNGVGQHIQNFFGDSLMISSFGDNSWIMNWRVFYYAWFIAWTPFVGMFIARISKGRTIREFIVGTVLIPTVFTIVWLSVFGTIALSATGDWGLEAVKELAASPQTAVFIIFSKYPLSKVISALIIALLAVFFITSADSATYALSMMSSDGDIDAPKYKKVVWGIIEATVAYVLLSVGSLKALQTASIAASLPFLFIMIAMVPALIKALKDEF
ncbi:BCCT family transporter [Lachnospiraceae bacterium 48-21]